MRTTLGTVSSWVPVARRLLHLSLLAMLALTVVGGTGCKSKKKLLEEQARAEAEARQQQIAQLSSELQAMMSTPVRDMADLEAREDRLADIRALGIDDAGLNALIDRVVAFLASERERLTRTVTPEPPADPHAALKTDLNSRFDRIASAPNVSTANAMITSTMKLFSAGDTPVLIIISEAGGSPDYDRPTTVERYLNYLKDQKRSPNQVKEVKLDSNGKVRELVLIKTN
ncbi:MAG: hypothetical protein D6722_15000 [Bacteroidetes bacterium]|nr:MAG: hypothetical protein D6722_15000 [Bacteroidota bacterium]